MSLDSREIRRISKDQLPGMVTPMFIFIADPLFLWLRLLMWQGMRPINAFVTAGRHYM